MSTSQSGRIRVRAKWFAVPVRPIGVRLISLVRRRWHAGTGPCRGGHAAVAGPWRSSLPRSRLPAAWPRSARLCRLWPALSGWDHVARDEGPVVPPCGAVAAGDRTCPAPGARVNGDQIPKDHAEELADCFAAYAAGLFGYACALTQGDHALADDLVQSAFMAAARPAGHATGAEHDPQSYLASRQAPVIRTPGTRRNHDCAEERRQFSRRDSHFTQRTTFRFSEALSPREHLPGKGPNSQLTRIDAADRLFSVPLT